MFPPMFPDNECEKVLPDADWDALKSQLSSDLERYSVSQLLLAIMEKLDKMEGRQKSIEGAVRNQPINLYADDRKIAKSASRGNASIGRR